MPTRIPWDRYEVALLVSAYERVAKGADTNTEARVLSDTLRNLAISRNIAIDETFRNVNGMKMQLGNVQWLLTDGQRGLSGASSLIRQMVELYQNQPTEFQVILKEAIRLTGKPMSIEDAFFAYAKGKSTLPPAMLEDYLKKASDYCHLRQSLLGTTDVRVVRDAQQKIANGKLLRFRYGKDAQQIRDITQLYYSFIKTYQPPKAMEEAIVATISEEENSADPQQNLLAADQSGLYQNPAGSNLTATDDNTVPVLHTHVPVYLTEQQASDDIIDCSPDQLALFRRFLIQEKGFAERTAGNYWTSIRMIEAYIQRNNLDFSLLNTDAAGAQSIFDLLMARPDFEQINIQRHRQFSAALAQYVIYLRQGRSDLTPHDKQKLPGQKSITETVFDVLRQAGKPMTVSEIYQAIIKDDLYPFGAQDPQSVVYSKVSLACRQAVEWIKEGRDVLIRSEVDGRKVFHVMSAKEAASYLQVQQSKAEMEAASSWAEYEAVLKQAFLKGFQKESGLDMKKLRKRWAEIHGEELKDTDDVVRLQLATHCVDTGKRWYLAELLLSEEDRQTVLNYIDRVLDSGKSVLYYSSIYAALEHQLESTVLTEDLLTSYLRATCQDRYILREHYLTNDQQAQVNLAEEIKDVMLANGRPIHTDELKRALHYLPPDQVERELHIHSEFIMLITGS